MTRARWIILATMVSTVGCADKAPDATVDTALDSGAITADASSLGDSGLTPDAVTPPTDGETPDASTLVEIGSPVTGAIVCKTVTVTLMPHGVPPGMTFACELDGKPLECSPPTLTLKNLAGGSHTVKLTATRSGQSSSAQTTFTVDDVAPVVTITTPAAQATTCPDGTIAYTATDSVSAGGSLDLDSCETVPVTGGDAGSGAACGGTSAMPTYTALATGSHRLTLRVSDSCNNVGEASQDFAVSTCVRRQP